MSFSILDGKGSGKEAGVDDNNRLLTNSIVEDISNHVTEYGGKYNLNTGNITLTGNATESAVMYLKNNEEYDYTITAIVYNLGSSASGTGQVQCDVYFKTTGGTIVSGATDVDINVNQNLGSASALVADVYKGAEANTQTGGTLAVTSLINPATRAFIGLGQILVPKGESISITMTTPSGNTSMTVQCALVGYVNLPAATGGTL
jgi:hypothetical protein